MEKRFKPYNSKRIIDSFKRIFETGDIDHLSYEAYQICHLYLSFIAHYNHNGFKETYRHDLTSFTEQICSVSQPDRYTRDKWFEGQYGKEYCESVSTTCVAVVQLAKANQEKMKMIDFHRGRAAAANQIANLKRRYNL